MNTMQSLSKFGGYHEHIVFGIQHPRRRYTFRPEGRI